MWSTGTTGCWYTPSRGRPVITSVSPHPLWGVRPPSCWRTAALYAPHAGYLVNLLHVAQLRRSSLLLDNGTSVPVSRGRGREVKARFKALFQGEEPS